jgi:hypothetical protein
MLEKYARNPSADPVQEKLRQDKANWNKEVSSFINDLIHLKKTMNGWPSKFYKERSRITQPVPADATTILGSLAGDFQQLAQQGESIVQEQLNYSKNRRQKQPKPTAAPTPQGPATPEAAPAAPTAGGPDLSKQLAAWEQKYGDELVAEGSSKLTRTWTRALNFPGSVGWGNNAKLRRHRMNMLKRATTVYKLLGKLQVKIVAPFSGKASIKDSYELLRVIKNEWDMVDEALQAYKVLSGEELSDEDTKKEIEELKKQKGNLPKEEKKSEPDGEQTLEPAPAAPPEPPGPTDDLEAVTLAKDIKNEYTSVLKGNIGMDSAAALSAVVNKFIKEPGLTKADVARSVIQQYNALLEALRAKYGVVGNSLKEIESAITAKNQVSVPPGVTMPKNGSGQIEIVAQDFIKKWIGKARHSTFSGDTSDLRMNIFDMAKELRLEVDKFMDLAESRKTLVPQYEEQSKKISTKMHKASSHMMKLYKLYFRIPKEMQGLV